MRNFLYIFSAFLTTESITGNFFENESYFSQHLWTIYSTIGLILHMQFTNGNSNHLIFCLLVMILMDDIRHREIETNWAAGLS